MKIFDFISEKEIEDAVLGDYERKLVLYKLTDEQLKKKYGTNYDTFEKENVVKKKDYSWEVEKDAMEWEHTVEGIRYLGEKINKLKDFKNGN